MIVKGENKAALDKKLKKGFQRGQNVIQAFFKTHVEINLSIVKNTL